MSVDLQLVVRNLQYFEAEFDSYLETILRPPVVPGYYHSSGKLLQYLSHHRVGRNPTGKGLKQQHVDWYFRDNVHGIVHGLMTGWWAAKLQQAGEYTSTYLTERQYKYDEECLPLIGQCLVHDMGRVFGNKFLTHDVHLAQLFMGFPGEVYAHSKKEKDRSHSLVQADRLELYRFDHESDFIKDELMDDWLPPYSQQARDPDTLLGTIYRYVRPAMDYIQEYMNVPWVRHGPEETYVIQKSQEDAYKDWKIYGESHINPDSRFWPAEYWAVRGCMSVEVGKLPFRYPVTRDYDPVCSAPVRTRGELGWTRPEGCIYPIGLVPMSHFYHATRIKDHAGVNADIGIDNWMFLYQNPTDLLHMSSTRSGKRIADHIAAGNRVRLMSVGMANKLYEVLEHIQVNLSLMCLNSPHLMRTGS